MTGIQTTDKCLSLQAGNQENRLQVIDITFTAGPAIGRQECTATIETSLGQQMQASFRTIAVVENFDESLLNENLSAESEPGR